MTGSGKRDIKVVANGLSGSSPKSQPSHPVLDRVIQAQIGDRLRAMYGELAEQPVPDRLSAILSRLGSAGRESKS